MICKKGYFNADVAKNLFFLSFLWGSLTLWIMVLHLGVNVVILKGFLVPPREIDGICYFRFLKQTLWTSMGYFFEILWDWFYQVLLSSFGSWRYDLWKHILVFLNMRCEPTWATYLEHYDILVYQSEQRCNDGCLRFLWEMENGDFALVICFSKKLCQKLWKWFWDLFEPQEKFLLGIEMWLRDNALPTGSGHFVIYWLVEVSSFEYSMYFVVSHVLAFVRDG
jgi:hypothetical protein